VNWLLALEERRSERKRKKEREYLNKADPMYEFRHLCSAFTETQ
jgi:hypothetical protein